MKGTISITEGAQVRVKGTDRVGKVLALTAEKIPGQRGRPKTLASIIGADGAEGAYSLKELVRV